MTVSTPAADLSRTRQDFILDRQTTGRSDIQIMTNPGSEPNGPRSPNPAFVQLSPATCRPANPRNVWWPPESRPQEPSARSPPTLQKSGLPWISNVKHVMPSRLPPNKGQRFGRRHRCRPIPISHSQPQLLRMSGSSTRYASSRPTVSFQSAVRLEDTTQTNALPIQTS